MKTEFVEVWQKGAFGHRDKRHVNPRAVNFIISSSDGPDECILVFAGGERMLIEGSHQKTTTAFACATCDV